MGLACFPVGRMQPILRATVVAALTHVNLPGAAA
jgi:hypothetical protein